MSFSNRSRSGAAIGQSVTRQDGSVRGALCDHGENRIAQIREAEVLFRRHASWLRRALESRFGPELAEELVQETWLRLLAREPTGAVRQPKPFLFRVAANLVRDRRRRDAVRPSCDPIETLHAPPSAQAGQAETLTLKQIISAMPPLLRDVFLLSRVGGMSYQSIADHLNISVKAVEWRMSKALAHCAEQLRD